MKRSLSRRAALLSVAILLAACGGDPSAPSSLGFTGRWTGTLSLRGGLDSGQAVSLDLVDRDGRIDGSMVDWDGVSWVVGGDERLLSATWQPATSECSALALSIEEVSAQSDRPVALSGTVTGRCYGTAAGSFRLARN